MVNKQNKNATCDYPKVHNLDPGQDQPSLNWMAYRLNFGSKSKNIILTKDMDDNPKPPIILETRSYKNIQY